MDSSGQDNSDNTEHIIELIKTLFDNGYEKDKEKLIRKINKLSDEDKTFINDKAKTLIDIDNDMKNTIKSENLILSLNKLQMNILTLFLMSRIPECSNDINLILKNFNKKIANVNEIIKYNLDDKNNTSDGDSANSSTEEPQTPKGSPTSTNQLTSQKEYDQDHEDQQKKLKELKDQLKENDQEHEDQLKKLKELKDQLKENDQEHEDQLKKIRDQAKNHNKQLQYLEDQLKKLTDQAKIGIEQVQKIQNDKDLLDQTIKEEKEELDELTEELKKQLENNKKTYNTPVLIKQETATNSVFKINSIDELYNYIQKFNKDYNINNMSMNVNKIPDNIKQPFLVGIDNPEYTKIVKENLNEKYTYKRLFSLVEKLKAKYKDIST